MLADAQAVRWQSKHGREPTIQQRSWLGGQMMATKLNVQVIIKNLQNMHEKSLPLAPTGARRRMELAYQDCQWARLQGRGPLWHAPVHVGGLGLGLGPFDRTNAAP